MTRRAAHAGRTSGTLEARGSAGRATGGGVLEVGRGTGSAVTRRAAHAGRRAGTLEAGTALAAHVGGSPGSAHAGGSPGRASGPAHAWRTRRSTHAGRSPGPAHVGRSAGAGRARVRSVRSAHTRVAGRPAIDDRLREALSRAGIWPRRTALVGQNPDRPTGDDDLIAGRDGTRLHNLTTVEVGAVGRAEILELKASVDPGDPTVAAGDTGGLQAQVVALAPADGHGRPIEGHQPRGVALFAERKSNHGTRRRLARDPRCP